MKPIITFVLKIFQEMDIACLNQLELPTYTNNSEKNALKKKWQNLEKYKGFLENGNKLEYLKKLLYSSEWGGNI